MMSKTELARIIKDAKGRSYETPGFPHYTDLVLRLARELDRAADEIAVLKQPDLFKAKT